MEGQRRLLRWGANRYEIKACVETRPTKTPSGKRRTCRSVEVIWPSSNELARVQGERSNQIRWQLQQPGGTLHLLHSWRYAEDKFKLSSHALSCCFSHPADAVNNEQNTESGCQTGSQMDSVGIGEVRQCDDEWRTELAVLGKWNVPSWLLNMSLLSLQQKDKKKKKKEQTGEISKGIPKCSWPKHSLMKHDTPSQLLDTLMISLRHRVDRVYECFIASAFIWC